MAKTVGYPPFHNTSQAMNTIDSIPKIITSVSNDNQGLLVGVVIFGVLVIILTGIVIFLAILIIKTKERMQLHGNTNECLPNHSKVVATSSHSNSSYNPLNPEQAYDQTEQRHEKLVNVSEMQCPDVNSDTLTKNAEPVATTSRRTSAYMTLNPEQTDLHEHQYTELDSSSSDYFEIA